MFNLEAIYDAWKTTELIVNGTIAAGARLRFGVDIATLTYNERDDVSVAFARVNLVAALPDALADLVFMPVPMAPLLEPVRRHNVITRVGFILENVSGAPLVLNTANPADDTGQALPAGLLIMISGEPGAPLWEVGQARVALPAYVPVANGGWSVKSRFNAALPYRYDDIS